MEEKKERPLMSEKEFKENLERLKNVGLINFSAVSRFRSVKRAIRRGHVSPFGAIYPKRPFNNRTSKKGSRPFNELKKEIYGQYRSKFREVRQAV